MSTPPDVSFRGLPRTIPVTGSAADEAIMLRALTIDDVAATVALVNANLDHLRAWMPWAATPATAASQGEFLRLCAEGWERGTDFAYGIVRGEARLIGGCGMHARRGPGVLEIGYWIAADEQGNGIVTAAARALTRTAAGVDGVERVVICCDEANVRSAAIPRRLGYTCVKVEAREALAASETGWHMVWQIDAATVRDTWSD